MYRAVFVEKQIEFRYLVYLRFLKQILAIDFTWVLLISHTEAMIGENWQLVTKWLVSQTIDSQLIMPKKISPIAAPDLKGDTSYKDVLSSLTICFLGWFLVGSALGLLIRV